MRCDVCHEREANTQVRIYLNGFEKNLRLCNECFSQMRSSYKSPVGTAPSPNFGGIDELLGMLSGRTGGNTLSQAVPPVQGNGGFLDEFGRNLTDMANQGRIDPVIGRDEEVARVIEILNRRNKNNPVLIGEPGVGKTAIAEGLALRIAEGSVPLKLHGKQVYTLDVASLVADTGIRGQFEERMKKLIAELQARPEVILFIDEIHLVVGAGSAGGSMDAGNILKPGLARGELQVIGATTLKEYRQIEKDAALERRFQPVIVKEPSVDEAVQILKGIRSKYEAYHGVRFSDEALVACVTLSNRYISDRFLPDKAIDLLDEAGSKVNLMTPEPREDVHAKLSQVVAEKESATKLEEYERAALLHKEEQRLRKVLETQASSIPGPEVTVADIERIVEEKTGIPVRKIEKAEQEKLRDLEAELSGRVIGQSNAVKKVVKAIRRSRTGLRKGDRPIGSFLFVGPTGVGKTELAKSLAYVLFGSKEAMIRLDMSEYMERHSVSKLVGSPPGYVGYEEAGQLTEQVRRNPYSLILLDEIEKAHPDVQHMFLQIMEDGRLTDSQGRTVSFKDTIIIMTSNAGVMDRKVSLGFHVEENGETPQTESQITGLTYYFKPEFLNRFDAIVEFAPLQTGDLTQIVELFLGELKETLAHQNILLEWSSDAALRLAELGYHPTLGARPLRRVIQDQVEDKIADVLVDEPVCAVLTIDVNDTGDIIVQPAVSAVLNG